MPGHRCRRPIRRENRLARSMSPIAPAAQTPP